MNVTLESALDKWTEVNFETGAAKPRTYLFGAILFPSMEAVNDFAVKDISLTVLIAIFSPYCTA